MIRIQSEADDITWAQVHVVSSAPVMCPMLSLWKDLHKQMISISQINDDTKVRKAANIRNRYNQVPHLTQDTTWESDKNTTKHHKQESRGQPPAGDHKAATNRRESTRKSIAFFTNEGYNVHCIAFLMNSTGLSLV